MIKDINGLGVNTGPTTNSTGKAAKQAESPNVEANNTAANNGQSDEVELSSQVQTLQALEAKLQAVPDVNIARVETIKQALEEGSFKIDDLVLADKLINSDALLGE